MLRVRSKKGQGPSLLMDRYILCSYNAHPLSLGLRRAKGRRTITQKHCHFIDVIECHIFIEACVKMSPPDFHVKYRFFKGLCEFPVDQNPST